MKNFKVIAITVAAVVAFSLGLYFFGGLRNYLDARALAKYKKDKETYLKQIDELQKKFIEANARADAAETRATVAEKQVPALEAELQRFGAAGQRAVERQEKAKETYEAETKSILGSSDACKLCRDTCAEREALSDPNDPARDFRCAAGFCDAYCAPR